MSEWKTGDPMRISIDKIKDSKTVECSCGGVMFSEKTMFKRLSAFISPSGKEELYPLQIITCDNCGKVPSELNPYDMVPEKYVSSKNKTKNKK